MRILSPFLMLCLIFTLVIGPANANEEQMTANSSQSAQSASTTAPAMPNGLDPNLAPALNFNKLQSGEETLNVGHYKHLPPFYFENSSAGKQPGFGYEIFTEVAKKAGIKKINFIGFDNSVNLNQQLKEGKIDVIANSWDLPGMRKHFLLTTPYYSKGGLSLLYYKDKVSFKTLQDLQNHFVGALQGGYASRYWLPSHGVAQSSIKNYAKIGQLFTALQSGDIDVAVIYYPLAKFAKNKSSDMDVLLVEPINDVYALRKQDIALQNALNQAITDLSTEGALEKIVKVYLDPAEVVPADSTAT